MCPHAYTAVSPVHANSLRATVALRWYPSSPTPLPSHRVKRLSATARRSVPAAEIAAERCSAQSPPLGMPCGSRYLSLRFSDSENRGRGARAAADVTYVGAASRSTRPRIVRSRTGAAGVPETLKSTLVSGASKRSPSPGAAPSVPLGWK